MSKTTRWGIETQNLWNHIMGCHRSSRFKDKSGGKRFCILLAKKCVQAISDQVCNAK